MRGEGERGVIHSRRFGLLFGELKTHLSSAVLRDSVVILLWVPVWHKYDWTRGSLTFISGHYAQDVIEGNRSLLEQVSCVSPPRSVVRSKLCK
jgi:hypothetical protein